MDAEGILADAEARIGEVRTAQMALRLADAENEPLPSLACRVRLTSHEFKLGSNAFRLTNVKEPDLQAAYRERYAALLNYATLPFYWGNYEPAKDETSEERLGAMAAWCTEHGVATKGHPLAWHEVFPEWAKALPDEEVLARLQRRVREITTRFRGRIDIWDVVNEATVSERFDNAVGRWIKREGAAACVAKALGWARAGNPDATLLYNDFNVSPAFEDVCAALVASEAGMDAIGIQSHMHQGHWPIERAWEVCETYARFGRPLHFTELTIPSGRFKEEGDNDWHRQQTDWVTTPEGEARQLAYGQQLYTVLFSHPAVEAITWWDFSDYGSWQGAPAGMVRKDMTPKPLYEWLVDAFRQRWWTDETRTADETGWAHLAGFFGEYEVTTRADNGRDLRGTFRFARRGEREITVTMA